MLHKLYLFCSSHKNVPHTQQIQLNSQSCDTGSDGGYLVLQDEVVLHFLSVASTSDMVSLYFYSLSGRLAAVLSIQDQYFYSKLNLLHFNATTSLSESVPT